MGIPKFYRWISERYPLINQPVKVAGVPEMDNFYLDMNGIVHNCSHGNDPSRVFTEEQMMARVFRYLEMLFQIVKPRRVMFMAIDGVAPRAKMNQQRSRRFKAGRERELALEEKRRKGQDVGGHTFDSNCITPGTEFMARLSEHLLFFTRKKMAEDPAWRVPAIVFSGPDVPGEGEHKIMEYIRTQRLSRDWQPNQRHCLYGLDADLIMLALVTHEPHFCLLREVVSFTGGGRGQPAREAIENPTDDHFVLLQVGMLREYLDLEFRPTSPPFPYNLENVIDDFVLFCMLVGNDFLPALPTLDIGEGGLDTLIALYKATLPSLGGYLTNAGRLNRGRLEALLRNFGEKEREILEQRAADAESFERRRGGKQGRTVVGPRTMQAQPGTLGAGPMNLQGGDWRRKFQALKDAQGAGEGDDAGSAATSSAWVTGLGGTAPGDEDGSDASEEAAPAHLSAPTMMAREARELMLAGHGEEGLALWKERYCTDKLGLPDASPASRARVVKAYVEGLHWVLEYYYRGVASWEWYYPFHFSPPASDLQALSSVDVAFRVGAPFRPFQQLLSVLPRSSAALLPEPYRRLMTDPRSPILDFYPEEFKIDYEGKRAEWEGVALICFIDESRLVDAESRMVPPGLLTAAERARNAEGSVFVFTHDPDSTDEDFLASTCPSLFASLPRCNSTVRRVPRPPPLLPSQPGFEPRLLPGTETGVDAPPGIPSLAYLPLSTELMLGAVNVFGNPSKKESLVIKPRGLREAMGAQATADGVAANRAFLQSRVFVAYPWLQEAQVAGVSDGTVHVTSQGVRRVLDRSEAVEWQEEADDLMAQSLTKRGILLGECPVLLHVRPVEGLVRNFDGTVERRFSRVEARVPLQLVVRHYRGADRAALSLARALTLFPDGCPALFLGRAHFGCLCHVLGPSTQSISAARAAAAKGGAGVAAGTVAYRVRLQAHPANAAQVAQLARSTLASMQPPPVRLADASKRLGVDFKVVATLTSSFWVKTGRDRGDTVDIGLAVKSNRDGGQCVPDYARPDTRSVDEYGRPKGWVFTQALLQVLEKYKSRFPWVFHACAASVQAADAQGQRVGVAAWDLFPDLDPEAAADRVREAHQWLKAQGVSRRPLVPRDSRVAWDQAVRALQTALPQRLAAGNPTIVEMDEVAAALLLPPLDARSPLADLAGGTMDVGDRVIAIAATGTPPFGLPGTVVGAFDGFSEVLFDRPFPGGTDLSGRCEGDQGALMPNKLLLNLSKPRAVDTPAHAQPVRVTVTQGDASLAAAGTKERPASAPSQPRIPAKFDNITAAIGAMQAKLGGMGPTSRPVPATAAPPPPSAAAGQLIAQLQAVARAAPPPPSAPGPAPPSPSRAPPPPPPRPPSDPTAASAMVAMLRRAAQAPASPPPPPPPPATPPPATRVAVVVRPGKGEKGGQGRGGKKAAGGGRGGKGGKGAAPAASGPTVATPAAAAAQPWGGAQDRAVAAARAAREAMLREQAGVSEDDVARAWEEADRHGGPSERELQGQTIESVFQEMAAKFRNEREQRMGRKEGRGQGATPAAPAATGAPDEHDFWRLLQARGGAQ